MRNTVLVIGDKLRYSGEYLEYFKRKVMEKITKVDAFLFIRENDPNILVELESYIEKSQNIVIAAPKSSFVLIGKTLATHMQDSLVQKGDMLIPSKSLEYASGSYLASIKEKLINVIRLEADLDVAPILIQERLKIKKAFILNDDEESAKALIAQLASSSEIVVSIFKNRLGYIEIVAEEKKYGNLESFMTKLQKLLGQKIIVADSLESYLIASLRAKNMKIAFSESCTGGLLTYKLAKISGASDVLIGSLVTYANDAKIAWLRVDDENIEKEGAVSESTVAQMLDGTLKISLADIAVAISGIAGPSGATDEKPVGLVYIGVKRAGGICEIEKKLFFGDREMVQASATEYAIKMICKIF